MRSGVGPTACWEPTSSVTEDCRESGLRFGPPECGRASVIGDFNGWNERVHPMRPRGSHGVWELFLPGVPVGARYKFSFLDARGRSFAKADPFAREAELRPATASIVSRSGSTMHPGFDWTDGDWIQERAERHAPGAALSVYEVHPPSWRRHPGAKPREGEPGWLSWEELADTLLPYVRDLGFTHVQLLPIAEHPLDRSWGYQTTGYFAPTARLGTPDGLRRFVDRAHALGLGVLLDWVPAHFPGDAHGLGRFTGAPLFEHADPRRGIHPDWGTYIFNYGRNEVRNFLSQRTHCIWFEESIISTVMRVDAVVVDVVPGLLGVKKGEWVPNEQFGGNENLEADRLLEEILNRTVHPRGRCRVRSRLPRNPPPGPMRDPRRSDLHRWPRASTFKWNMGWMHDTLEVMSSDPLFRKGLYEKLTFSIMYAFSERFQLALSHDEMVHLKGSLLRKMSGSPEQKFASLRLLYGYMWTHPGKKLLFMGSELAQWSEWDFEGEVDWALLDVPLHAGVKAWLTELNRAYRSEPALHATDHDGRGFEWIDCHDFNRTVLAFLRWAPEWTESLAVVANFAAVPWPEYRLPVPTPGIYDVLLNSDAAEFAGGTSEFASHFPTQPGDMHGRGQWIEMDLPALSLVVLKHRPGSELQAERRVPSGEDREGDVPDTREI